MKDRTALTENRREFTSSEQLQPASVVFARAIRPAKQGINPEPAKGRELVVTTRLLLFPSELSRLPRSSRALRVRSGAAWVTHGGRDIVASEGETVWLRDRRDLVLAAPLYERPLVLEVLARGN